MTSRDKHGVSNHRRLGCLFNSLFKLTTNGTTKAPHHWPFAKKYTSYPIAMREAFPCDVAIMIENIKNNACVTVNNDFWSRVRRFANNFHELRSHEWKSLANCFTSDHKIVIHGNECIILFLTRYFMSWTHNSANNKSSIAHFAIVAKDGIFWLSNVTSPQLICDVTRTWGTGIVTSYSSIVFARENWRKGDIH